LAFRYPGSIHSEYGSVCPSFGKYENIVLLARISALVHEIALLVKTRTC